MRFWHVRRYQLHLRSATTQYTEDITDAHNKKEKKVLLILDSTMEKIHASQNNAFNKSINMHNRSDFMLPPPLADATPTSHESPTKFLIVPKTGSTKM
jgi:hypothetical protein